MIENWNGQFKFVGNWTHFNLGASEIWSVQELKAPEFKGVVNWKRSKLSGIRY